MSIYGAERAWEGLFRGIRSRVCINIGKPFGPYEIKGSKKQKNEAMKKAGGDMMCRVASLLPENRRGVHNNDKRVLIYQKENQIVPTPHNDFKPQKEET